MIVYVYDFESTFCDIDHIIASIKKFKDLKQFFSSRRDKERQSDIFKLRYAPLQGFWSILLLINGRLTASHPLLIPNSILSAVRMNPFVVFEHGTRRYNQKFCRKATVFE